MKKNIPIIFLLIVISIIRFVAFTGKGAYAFPDEERYTQTTMALKSLSQGNLRGFCTHISSTNGRPGDSTLKIIPMAFQYMLYKYKGIDPTNPESLLIPVIFNIIICSALLFVFYRLTLVLFNNNEGIALVAALIYGLLVNSNIYIRHIFPYDGALLCFFCVLYYGLNKVRSYGSGLQARDAFIMGLLAGLGFTLYPGYYFFVVLIFSVLFFDISAIHFDKRIFTLFSKSKYTRCAIFIGGFTSIIAFYELVSRLGGVSYVFTSAKVALLINQGSYEEGFSFLPKYLLQVEGATGAIILIFSLIYLAIILKEIISSKRLLIDGNYWKMLFVLISIGFIIHATATFLHKMVFYGRLLHMYFPFMIWATLSVIIIMKSEKWRRIAYAGVLASSAVCFLLFLSDYSSVAYPRDVLYQFGIDTHDPSTIRINETKEWANYDSPPPIDNKSRKPYGVNNHMMLVNFCFFYPLSDRNDFRPVNPAPAGLVFSGQHFQTFPAYSFEGFSIKERIHAKERRYKVSIYQRVQ
ncbi:MAG: hypothetical protein C0392_04455 [Syntrophus sp. (in: bacteria)]|nr:hypothetical protein [Syntrophus sp. (in: bacteria)]